ncbi:hypothetical protein [Nocardioides sp. AE5]|uniref:hypothetical protein n=1 Tax=Nocardioides sp. AE5 TaxID=2962573 RepID=UPI0028826A12|nr:hypothetical protein [Nocardioides sp. AE5]MDT0202820.1 hypothetical protein [Nocardioides sp. AE5]
MTGTEEALVDFDPELIGRLNRWERRAAQWCYRRWPDESGRYPRAIVPMPWPPSRASRGRDAAMAGVAISAVLLTLGWGVVLIVVLAADATGMVDLPQSVVDSDLVVLPAALPMAWIFVRCFYLNRFFIARHGDELRPFPFHLEREVPLLDPEQSPGSKQNRTAAAYAQIREQGDPRVVAPEVVADLTRWEQAHLDLRLRHRLRQVGLNAFRYPDDEPASSIARRIGVGAVGSLARRIAARVGLVALAAFAVLVVEVDLEHEVASPAARMVLLACLGILIVLVPVWVVRRWQVGRWFARVAGRPTA